MTDRRIPVLVTRDELSTLGEALEVAVQCLGEEPILVSTCATLSNFEALEQLIGDQIMGIDEDAAVEPPASGALREDLTDCPECADWLPLDREHHDHLIAWMEGRVADMAELIVHVELSADGEDGSTWDRPLLSWVELPDFVARHNWTSPSSAYRVAQFLSNSQRYRRRR